MWNEKFKVIINLISYFEIDRCAIKIIFKWNFDIIFVAEFV